MPSARAIATNSTVCSLQSPTFVRSTSSADGKLTVGRFSTSAFISRVSRSARARAPVTPCDQPLRLGANLRRIAFDERLGLQIAIEIGGRRARP